MKLIEQIDKFAVDIYFLMPVELLKEYQSICAVFVNEVEHNFSGDVEMMTMQNKLLNHLLKTMETNDFVRMADALKYQLKPFVEELHTMIETR